MDFGNIIADSFIYPFRNIKSLLLVMVIGVIACIIGAVPLLTYLLEWINRMPVSQLDFNGFIELVILLIIVLMMQGYMVDIVKYGVERRSDAPGFNFKRQGLNLIKFTVVNVVYFIIPIILIWLFSIILGRGFLTLFIDIIILFVFSLGDIMAICKLAKSDSLREALLIRTAIDDEVSIGLMKIITIISISVIMTGMALGIMFFVLNFNNVAGTILLGIFGVYIELFFARAFGLLYSN